VRLHDKYGPQPGASRTKMPSALWFLAGLIIGAWLAMWAFTFTTAWERDKWACQRYSPLDGKCSLYLRRGQP